MCFVPLVLESGDRLPTTGGLRRRSGQPHTSGDLTATRAKCTKFRKRAKLAVIVGHQTVVQLPRGLLGPVFQGTLPRTPTVGSALDHAGGLASKPPGPPCPFQKPGSGTASHIIHSCDSIYGHSIIACSTLA